LSERVLVLFLFLGFLVVFVDYRVLKLFALGLPVSEERVWVFRDLVVFPFAAFLVCAVVEFLGKSISGVGAKAFRISSRGLLRVVLSVFVFVLIAGWVLASVFSVYPHFGPLQITSYELDAARHLKDVSDRSYVVIGDRYTDLAGGMIVGLNNPGAFYFAYTDPFGIKLFNEMVANPSDETMVKAMDFTNCTIAYFFVDRLRLGDSEFNRVVSAALLNGLERLPVGFGDGMLVVFRFEKIE